MAKAKKSSKKFQPENQLITVKNEFIFLCSCCAVILLLVITTNTISPIVRGTVLGTSTNSVNIKNLEKQYSFWNSFLKDNPTYFDGWIELYKIDNQLNKINEANNALEKAHNINPNSPTLIKILNSIN
jgi:hypothetical protein